METNYLASLNNQPQITALNTLSNDFRRTSVNSVFTIRSEFVAVYLEIMELTMRHYLVKYCATIITYVYNRYFAGLTRLLAAFTQLTMDIKVKRTTPLLVLVLVLDGYFTDNRPAFHLFFSTFFSHLRTLSTGANCSDFTYNWAICF